MTSDIASKHNTSKVSNSGSTFMMTRDGRLFSGWRQDGSTIYMVDAYGGHLATFTLGVDCVKVVRNRVTTVTETYTVED